MHSYHKNQNQLYQTLNLHRKNSVGKLNIHEKPENHQFYNNIQTVPFTERYSNQAYSVNHKKGHKISGDGQKRVFFEFPEYNGKENFKNEYFYEQDLKKRKSENKKIDFLDFDKKGNQKNPFVFEDLKNLKKENKNLKKEIHRLKKIENCWGLNNFEKEFSENDSIVQNYIILENNFVTIQNEVIQKNIYINDLEKIIQDLKNDNNVLNEKNMSFKNENLILNEKIVNIQNFKINKNENDLILNLEKENKNLKLFFEKQKINFEKEKHNFIKEKQNFEKERQNFEKSKNENTYFFEKDLKSKKDEISNLKILIKNLKVKNEKQRYSENINNNLKQNFATKCKICEKREKKLINYSKLLKKYKFIYTEKQKENNHWKKEILILQNSLQKYKSILSKIEIKEKYQKNKNKKHFDLEFFKMEIINLNQEKEFLLKTIQNLKIDNKKFEKKEIIINNFENDSIFLDKQDIEDLVLKNLLKNFEIFRIHKNKEDSDSSKIKDSFNKFFK